VRSAAGRSPLYDELWRRLADEPLVDTVVDEYTWDVPLKVLGALHYLVLEGRASWDDPLGALVEHRDFVRRYVVEQGIQTNEVQRCWMLLPCFLEIARHTGAEAFHFVEIGPSAGLNLVWDRYAYRYANGTWGPRRAPLVLQGEERTPVPGDLLALTPRVQSRVGIDVAPIDVTIDEGALLLKSFVWADMTSRLELLERAIDVLRADPPDIVRGDVVEELPAALARAGEDAMTVVVDTAALGYVPEAGRRRVYAALAEAGGRAPLAFVHAREPVPNEHTFWGMAIQLWPGGERKIVEHADFHGRWLSWLT
jgi:hypothetical protein